MRRAISLLSLLVLSACVKDADDDGFVEADDCNDNDVRVHPGAHDFPYDGIDQDCSGADVTDVDGDGSDGGDDGPDCEDGDASIHPGADEVCDGIDQDCDGIDDNGVGISVFADDDGDGFGDPTTELIVCDATGFATDGTDCDDGDAQVHPGATDAWYDGVDSDCAGNDDFDQDGDGASRGDDCDDTEPLAGPELIELAGDGVDNDCDGRIDQVDLADAPSIWDGLQDGDSVGEAIAGAGDVNGDGFADFVTSAWERYNPDQGVVYLIYGPATPGRADIDTADAVFTDHTNDWADDVGQFLDGGHDLNHDGFDDLLIHGGSTWPVAYVKYGGALSGELDLGDIDGFLYTEGSYGWSRGSGGVVFAGDLDGDGTEDVAISNPNLDGGVTHVVSGPASGTFELPADADINIRGRSTDSAIGARLTRGGDVTGDGQDDLVLSDWQKAYLFEGPVAGNLTPADADAKLSDASWGVQAAGAGDLTGDGVDDLLLYSGYWGDGIGRVFVMAGPIGASVSTTSAVASVKGSATTDHVGDTVDVAGDVDGDGVLDLVVGAGLFSDLRGGDGEAWILLGPLQGVHEMADRADLVLFGETDSSAGGGVAGVGDMDGDGFDDVVIGAPNARGATSFGNAGAVYLWPGG